MHDLKRLGFIRFFLKHVDSTKGSLGTRQGAWSPLPECGARAICAQIFHRVRISIDQVDSAGGSAMLIQWNGIRVSLVSFEVDASAMLLLPRRNAIHRFII